MKKSDVKFHNEGFGRTLYPTINIKSYTFGDGLDLEKEFGCNEQTAKQALEFAFDVLAESFFENVKESAKEIFDKYKVKVYRAGRMGGWLIIDGLPDIELWDAVILGKWAKFCKQVKEEKKYVENPENIKETILANEWQKEGSEKYNFYDKDGETVCIADLKQQAIAAGFGAVIR